MDLSWEAVDEGWSVLLCMRCRLPLGVMAHAQEHTPEQAAEAFEAQLEAVVQAARDHECRGWKERYDTKERIEGDAGGHNAAGGGGSGISV